MTVTYTDWVRDVQSVQCRQKRAYRCPHGWHYHIGHDRRTR